MNQRPSLREALHRADIAERDETAEDIGRAAGHAIAVALAEAEKPAEPQPERYRISEEEERQNLLDDALSDAEKAMERHRDRLGRRVTSRHDARVMRQIFELLRGMADASGGVDNDPSFQ